MSTSKKYILKDEFLQADKYTDLASETQYYESLVKKWAKLINDRYQSFNSAQITFRTASGTTSNFSQTFLTGVNEFLAAQMKVIKEHSLYLNDFVQTSSFPIIRKSKDQLIDCIDPIYSKFESYYKKKKELKVCDTQIEALTNQEKLSCYFEESWTKKKQLYSKYLQLTTSTTKTPECSEKIFGLTLKAEEQLIQFRRNIIKFKYSCLKHGVQFSRQIMECLAESVSIGLKMLRRLNDKLQLIKSQSQFVNTENSQVRLLKLKKKYEEESEIYVGCLKNLSEFFKLQTISTDHSALLQQFQTAFSGNHEFIDEMFQVLELYDQFSNEKIVFYKVMTDAYNEMKADMESKKASTAVLEVLGKKGHNEESYASNHASYRMSNNMSNRMSNRQSVDQNQFLENQLSTKVFEKTIKGLTASIEQAFLELSRKYLKVKQMQMKPKNNTNNSFDTFEISYYFKQIKIKNKKPNKNQSWLWKDWRYAEDAIQEIKPKYDVKEIKTRLELVDKVIASQQGSGPFRGILTANDESYKVLITVFSKKIELTADGKIRLNLLAKNLTNKVIIPRDDIQSMEFTDKKLKLTLVSNLKVVISSIENLKELEAKIKDNQPAEGEAGSAESGPAVVFPVLPEEEKQFIQQRLPKIESERDKLDEYKKYGEKMFQSRTIQEVYKYIFSDDTEFFKNLCSKLKNSNFTGKKYDTSGPCFYSGDKAVTFMNTAPFSTRASEYDHPLPPIPFLPKTCHCSETARMLWVSDKQLDFRNQVVQSGSSMVQAIKTSTLYRIKEGEGGTMIEAYAKVEFTQNVSMKSTLKSGAEGEFKSIVPIVLSEMERCMAATKRKAGNAAEKQATSETTDSKADSTAPPASKQSKLTPEFMSKIKYVFYVALTSVVLNMIIIWLR